MRLVLSLKKYFINPHIRLLGKLYLGISNNKRAADAVNVNHSMTSRYNRPLMVAQRFNDTSSLNHNCLELN